MKTVEKQEGVKPGDQKKCNDEVKQEWIKKKTINFTVNLEDSTCYAFFI